MGNIIEIKDLSKTFNQDSNPVRALEDINLEIEEGSFLSIIGGSGCGKSTLTRIIGGLDTEYEGGYLLDGKKVTGPSRDKGFIFQDHRLLPWLTVRENIRFALSAENKKNEDIILKNITVSKNLKKEYRKIADLEKIDFLAASDFAFPSEVDQEHLNVEGHIALADAIYNKLRMGKRL